MLIANIIFIGVGGFALACVTIGTIASLRDWLRTRKQRLPKKYYKEAAVYIIESLEKDRGEMQEV